MSILSNNALLFLGADQAAGYQISRSLRFNSSDSAYLSRTPASAGNRKTWTWAGWVKRSDLGTGDQTLFSGGTTLSNAGSAILFFRNNKLCYSSITVDVLQTEAVYRDASAWYHIVVAFDTTQATASSRLRFYVNGSEVTQFSTDARSAQLSQNTDYGVNQAAAHALGRFAYDGSKYFSGYLADIHFIDGQALTPSSFTEVSATTGQLIPKAYTGTYGTNGFWLKFSDNSAATATTLGKDYSGNGNNWTPNNLSVTAGAGNDSLVDTPTSFGTDTGAGGEVRGNYCTWNPLINGDTAANGNLDVTNDTARGTQKLLEYDAYWEITSTGGTTTAGVVSDGGTTNTTTVADGKTYGFKLSAAGALEYINITDGGSFTSITTGLTGIQFPYASAASSTTGSLNAGQRPFAATAPSGYKALCTTNLPDPVVAQPSTVMDVKLYTGNGSTQTISGLGFSPDFVWIKERNAAADHALYDIVRGTQARLESNTTDVEATSDSGLTAFNSDGFALSTLAQVNTNNDTYVAWTWDAGSSTVTNTQGSITSQVRANASAGFSIVTYTGNGISGATIGHGLGVAPEFFIVKCRNTVATGWLVYAKPLSATSFLLLESTAAVGSNATAWNNTAPSSTAITLGNSAFSNGITLTYVCYAFSPVAGYSNGFSYTGNGSTNGSFVYLGFRPRLILLKCSSTTGNWTLLDTAREGYNVDNDPLYPNLSNAEGTTDLLDITSNGFKLRTTDASVNSSGATYVGYAWAEAPFAYSRAR